MDSLRDQVIARLVDALEPRMEVVDAYLFGSLARGDYQPHSDIDVAVFVTESALAEPRGHGFGYQAELGAELQSALDRSDVDLVILNRATPALYHAVLRDGVRILSRNLSATTRREGYALSRYCDDLPRLRMIEAIRHGRIASGKFGL